ncbi:MAG: hypothetical protein PHS47_05215 [Methanocellales archaeon]|nr:hypothetical protein [Methanocellales archaeon]MDD3421679.1 hypothetical protein [Methanocellales archaeon]MDD4898658.1 hypothetical protein [Methanocellales archaeon]MDD5446290.1 hypothetical protein [Methanocellales archaeon]
MGREQIIAFALLTVVCFIMGWAIGYFVVEDNPNPCEITEMTYYYSEYYGRSECQRVKEDGTILKLKDWGITVVEIEIKTEADLRRYNLQRVPTFEIEGELYPGYMTFEQLKSLLKCY